MKKYVIASGLYTALGLLAGLLYRTLTHSAETWQFTQLNVLHTHLLVLGTIMMLVFLALERLFALRAGRWHRTFWITYNIGLGLTTLMMGVNGILTLNGVETMAGMRAGISGLGHIAITVAFVFFFLNLWSRVKALPEAPAGAAQPEQPVAAARA